MPADGAQRSTLGMPSSNRSMANSERECKRALVHEASTMRAEKCEARRRDYNEQRDRQQSPDRANRRVSGTRPALTGTSCTKIARR